jgi:hypothetical protein
MIKNFFEENNCQEKLFTSGLRNQSVDGTGILPSVNDTNNWLIKDFIKKTFSSQFTSQTQMKLLDVGAGVGFFQKGTEDDPEVLGFSFEGCSDLINHVVCDKSRYAIVDLSIPFSDERLFKAFDISTSFEVLEHVHRSHQDAFWNNLRFLSKRHFCSIHVANQEDEQHCTIQSLDTWIEYLKSKGTVTVHGGFPISPDLSQETFRCETNTLMWDCSIILSIEFF